MPVVPYREEAQYLELFAQGLVILAVAAVLFGLIVMAVRLYHRRDERRSEMQQPNDYEPPQNE